MKFTEIERALKPLGYKRQEIARNLEYLTQAGYVRRETEFYPMRRGGREIVAKAETYKIADIGVDYSEGTSKFARADTFAGINVVNIQGVTVIGRGNVVYAQFANLFAELDRLEKAVAKSAQLGDEEKLAFCADIETIKSQLSKPAPDKDIVRRAWEGLRGLSTVAGLASFLEKVHRLLTLLGLLSF